VLDEIVGGCHDLIERSNKSEVVCDGDGDHIVALCVVDSLVDRRLEGSTEGGAAHPISLDGSVVQSCLSDDLVSFPHDKVSRLSKLVVEVRLECFSIFDCLDLSGHDRTGSMWEGTMNVHTNRGTGGMSGQLGVDCVSCCDRTTRRLEPQLLGTGISAEHGCVNLGGASVVGDVAGKGV
jgi:hypothetical protein